MSGFGNDPPHTPESVATWIKTFPLDTLEFETDTKSTQKPTSTTYRVWEKLEERGIRVVYDENLNGRLHASLGSQQVSLGNGVTRDMEDDLRAGRRNAQRITVDSEPILCSVMLTNFFNCSTDAINAGLPSHLHGKWEPCADKGSGCPDWEFRRNGIVIAIIEVKLPSVLTTAGEDAVSQTDKKEDSDNDYVPSDEEKPQNSPHLSSRLEQSMRECKQEGGLKLILVERKEEDGKVQPALRIVDQQANIALDMTHWAMALSQLWEELDCYDLDLVILTSYEVWIPFERDPDIENVLRVGDPIYRTEPGTAPEPGKLSPMELAVASVIERERAPPLPFTFSPLPVLSSSKASRNESTQNDQNERGAVASGSKGTKRGYDTVESTGSAGSDNAIDGNANIPRNQLAPVTLQVSVLNHRSSDARHYFNQTNLDNGYITGRLSPSVIASLADDNSIHSGLPTSELKAHLALSSYISSGRLWDVYHSVLTVEGRVSKKLVAKVMCPDTYDDGDEYYEGSFEDSKEAVAAYRLEAALYSGPLASLQGGAVPASYGSFSGAMSLRLISGGYPLHIELMEDVGGAAAGEGKLRDLPLQDRQAIRKLYQQLHAVRVLHRDVEPRHILRRADGRFALIDFDSSRSVEDGPEGDRRLASEGRWVAAMLGLKDRAARKRSRGRPKAGV